MIGLSAEFCAAYRAAGGDLAVIDRRFVGDTALFRDSLCGFIAQDGAEACRSAAASGDREALMDAAHRLKGNAGLLGLNALQAAAAEVVAALRAGKAPDPAQIDRVTQEFIRAEALLGEI